MTIEHVDSTITPSGVSSVTASLGIVRHYTRAGENPLDTVEYAKRTSKITNPDGSIVFEMKDVEVPKDWSQLATDIMVSKYFRKGGVPETGHEVSARQVVHRIANTIRVHGQKSGYFGEAAGATFEAELAYMLIHQIGAFNSPVWFNVGLYQQYGIEGTGGNFRYDPATQTVRTLDVAYEHPQSSACFLQAVNDNLMDIFDLVKNEVRLFKQGSGTGSSFDKIRGKGEKLSSGGESSGLMSWLKVLDAAAGSIKSGGTTRRSATMRTLSMDHPDIEAFITWKVLEEKKAQALIAQGYPSDFNGEAYATISGQNSNNSVRVTDEFMRAVENDDVWQTTERTSGKVAKTYKARDLWKMIAESAHACADPGVQYDTTINHWHTVPKSGRINTSNPCVTGDTLVSTTMGVRRIDSLLSAPLRVVGLDGATYEVRPAFVTGQKPVYRLRTRAGYELKLTADHRVFTENRGDVPVSELSKDDVVRLGRVAFGAPQGLSTHEALVLGAMLGNGCISDGVAVLTVHEEHEALARACVEHIQGFKRVEEDGRSRREVNAAQHGLVLRVATSLPAVVQRWERFAVLDKGSENKALTDQGMTLSVEETAYMLRGLFTTDGTVADYADKSQYVALDSSSTRLLQQVQVLLLGFGIKSKLYRDRRPLGQTHALLPDGKGGQKEYPVQQMHSLRVSRSSRVRFEQQIGFLEDSQKAARLHALNQRVGAYEDKLVDRVESLEFVGIETVYDLTEPETHHFVANGIVVHNCSEFVHLDQTACNLASLNLTKFLRDDGSYDVEAYRHAVRIFLVAQEILVGMSSYPTAPIAEQSYKFRPLGLGYANLGTLLMTLGLSYDSDEGRTYAACITAIMHCHAGRVSAEMAAVLGPFEGHELNKAPMRDVMLMHKDAALRIPAGMVPESLRAAVYQDARDLVAYGDTYGYRNSQISLLAPTGTIGFLMDCATTGIEPDFALVKYKKLAGGGSFKIINEAVPEALKRLGYTPSQIDAMMEHALGTLNFARGLTESMLREKGLTPAEIEAGRVRLRGAFSLDLALSTPALLLRLDVPKETHTAKGFSLLGYLGFSRELITQATTQILGHGTLEGAPGLKPEHLAVFDCANRCGDGTRYLAPLSHLKMMAAVQPFLSGAISKTANLPTEATVEDVADIYMQGWKLGLKAVALYRDGCKASQPLNTKHTEEKALTKSPETMSLLEAQELIATLHAKHGVAVLPKVAPVSSRRRLPRKRLGVTQETRVNGTKIFLRTGEYPDGTLGEIFLDMHKEGASFRAMANSFAIAISMGLQYGVPLEDYVEQFTFTRFEPHGPVEGDPNIKIATSVLDYVFRHLGVNYLNRTDLAHVAPEILPSSGTAQYAARGLLESSSIPPLPLEAGTSSTWEAASLSPEMARSKKSGAPFCDICGHQTVRNGTCWRCHNCGASLGCS